MLGQRNFLLLAGTALGGCLTMAALPTARAATLGVPPPLSYPTAQYLKANPAARAGLLGRMAQRPMDAQVSDSHRFTATTGGTWSLVTTAPRSGLTSPELMTDGTVLVQDGDSPQWFRLTPDAKGNYAAGTWRKVAMMPVVGGTQYAPLYHATGVLPDGRMIVMGGEYNAGAAVWTNQGAIYDNKTNSWTPVMPPAGSAWAQIGDAQSVVLPSGHFMLASCCAYPDANALFNPQSLNWKATGAPANAGAYQDEQGYELMPNNNVLTIDIWTNYPNGPANNAEMYSGKAGGTWSPTANLPVSLPDPCGTYEIGPAVTRGNRTVVAFGANTGCTTPTDPTAIYNVSANSWTQGPNVPQVCGSSGTDGCDLADAPAALEPNGNILFAASSGYGSRPTHFFEFLPDNTIVQVSDPLLNASVSGSYYYNLLLLPSGQILMTDFSGTAEIYTPAGHAMQSMAPVVTNIPTTLTPGTTYSMGGNQLNGVSQGAYYGDDAQMATNYPVVRITNAATGDVAYARTFGYSSYSIKPGVASTAKFRVPTGIETGSSTLQVVANGVASSPISVTIN